MNASASAKREGFIAFIGLGSNIEPEKNLPRAYTALNQNVVILCTSSAWRAPAQGDRGPEFLNAVVKVQTKLRINDLKNKVLRPIEQSLGRIRGMDKNAPRTIDLDILIFDDEIYEPHVWDYAHLAVPLAECHPELADPDRNQTITQVSEELQTTVPIHKSTTKLERA